MRAQRQAVHSVPRLSCVPFFTLIVTITFSFSRKRDALRNGSTHGKTRRARFTQNAKHSVRKAANFTARYELPVQAYRERRELNRVSRHRPPAATAIFRRQRLNTAYEQELPHGHVLQWT